MPAKPDHDKSKPEETPHYHGHRERLRERFYSAGADALSDYELLEMALFPALPRRDTKPLAKTQIKIFGSFAEVVHAPVARLREVDGIGESAVHQLKLIAAAGHRLRGLLGGRRDDLEAALAAFEAMRAAPYAARVRTELGMLSGDAALVGAGLDELEQMGDAEQSARVAAERKAGSLSSVR